MTSTAIQPFSHLIDLAQVQEKRTHIPRDRPRWHYQQFPRGTHLSGSLTQHIFHWQLKIMLHTRTRTLDSRHSQPATRCSDDLNTLTYMPDEVFPAR